jgi:hypothetical protein
MRPILVLVAATTLAHADSQRECHLQSSEDARRVKQLGCFDDVQSTEDHTYGFRVCLLRAPNGVCSGVLWEWDGGPEGTALILEEATCGTKDGPVTFSASLPVTFSNGSKRVYARAFRGKLAKRALRGTFRGSDQLQKVTWRQTKDGFDPLERIQRETRAACTSPVTP